MDIPEIRAAHRLWVDTNGAEGRRANLANADLRDAYLCDANLQEAILQWADLQWTDLRDADLQWADLRDADLRGADLRRVNLQGADLQGAKLYSANLQWADLRGALLLKTDLAEAKISNCVGNGREIKTLIFDPWIVSYTTTTLAIGCQQRPISEWWEMSDAEINKMHPDALEWWKEWKAKIRAIVG